MRPSIEEIRDWDLAKAEVELSNRIYEAALLFERLENARKIRGNGHNIAQDIADKAVQELRGRWNR